jgi:hypothetical protein
MREGDRLRCGNRRRGSRAQVDSRHSLTMRHIGDVVVCPRGEAGRSPSRGPRTGVMSNPETALIFPIVLKVTLWRDCDVTLSGTSMIALISAFCGLPPLPLPASGSTRPRCTSKVEGPCRLASIRICE